MLRFLQLLLTYLVTYLFTHSMVQSHSWPPNWFAASQEIPRISRNPKVHYRTHKHPPPVSILGQPNPVHIPTSYFLEIRPNIIHPSTPRSLQWSLSLRFPHQDPIHPPSSTRAIFPAHLILLDFITRTILMWGVQIIQLLVIPLKPNDLYIGRTAPLTSKRFILYIYSTNIGTEYFKHGIYSPSFPLQNTVCFIIITYLVPVLFTLHIQSVLK